MTQLEIKTQYTPNQGYIELRPQPDETDWEVIHGLGITGISCIVERNDRLGESAVFIFERPEQGRLSQAAQSIAEAFSPIASVSLVEG